MQKTLVSVCVEALAKQDEHAGAVDRGPAHDTDHGESLDSRLCWKLQLVSLKALVPLPDSRRRVGRLFQGAAIRPLGPGRRGSSCQCCQ